MKKQVLPPSEWAIVWRRTAFILVASTIGSWIISNLVMMAMQQGMNDVGTVLALDVQGTDLTPLLPGMNLAWSPRPGRALFFDRAQHARPEVVIVPSAEVGSQGRI